MHAKRMIFAAMLTATAGLPSAYAADLEGPRRYRDPRNDAYYPTWNWTGLYIGLHGGYGLSSADWDFIGASLSNPGAGSVLGGQIGYNFQSGRMVYGIEGDLSSTWMNGTDGCGFLVNCRHDINWMGSVRGRLGFTVNDNRTLLYGTGGVAWADAKFASRDAITNAVLGSEYSVTQQGWVLGAGIEHQLSQNLTMRVEYLNYNFNGMTAPAGTVDVLPTKIDLSSQVVRFGLNLKF